LTRAGLRPKDLADRNGLEKLPVLTRRDLQTATGLFSAEIPRGHAPISKTKSSGSTGEPVAVHRTAINQLDWLAMTMREHFWHGRDFGKKLCAIRAHVRTYSVRADWGPPASLLFDTGPSIGLPISASVERLALWVAECRPDSLMLYPSTLDALTEYCRGRRIALGQLSHIRTIGETLSRRVRQEAQAVFKAKVADSYSAQEVGYLALECPESGLYHIPETVIVEVLNEHGCPCAPGEMGRVTVTDLRNFATPLVRYDIGDYAEVAAPCPCGRGLPTLARILGRERGLVLMPDGSRHWPLAGGMGYKDVAPIHQWQIIQLTRTEMEVRLATERPLSADEETKLRARLQKSLGYPFVIAFKYFPDRIPPGPTGKSEEFICKAE
jgi:phenylacetate-CoA ligase